MSVVVIGTNTGVGKTVVSSLLLWRYGHSHRKSRPLAYWKPISTGAAPGEPGADSDEVARLAPPGTTRLPESYRFSPPVSPHLAAQAKRVHISLGRLMDDYRAIEAGHGQAVVIEGIGGLHVPLDFDGTLLADFLVALELPCVLVAATSLGTFNHTLLTLEAMARRGLRLAALVLSGEKNDSARKTFERLVAPDVLLEVGTIKRVTAKGLASAAKQFDRRGRLRHHLQP